MVLDVETVLHEKRRRAKHFVAGLEHGPEQGVDAAGRTAGDDHLVGRHGHALLGGDDLGQALAHLGISGIRHVTESKGLFSVIGQFTQAIGHGCGRSEVRIAKAEIVDVLGAVLLLELDTRLEHAADPRRLGQIVFDLRTKNHILSCTTRPLRGCRGRSFCIHRVCCATCARKFPAIPKLLSCFPKSGPDF